MLRKIEERNASISNAKSRWTFLKEKGVKKNQNNPFGTNAKRGLAPNSNSNKICVDEIPPDMTISGAAPPSARTPRQRPRIINITQVSARIIKFESYILKRKRYERNMIVLRQNNSLSISFINFASIGLSGSTYILFALITSFSLETVHIVT